MNSTYINTIINKKTGLIFEYNKINNFNIYKYYNHLIVFNELTNIWGLLLDTNKIIIESNNLDQIIYKFLFDTNRLAIVVYGDNDVDEITEMMMNSKI